MTPSRLLIPTGLLLAVLLLGMVSSLAYPRTAWDSPTGTYVGQIILEGGTLYRDVWDSRGPGYFLVFALQLLLIGKSAAAMRLFDLLWQCATAFVLARAGRRAYGTPSAGAIAGFAYLVAYYSQNYWSWTEPEGYLGLPLSLAVLLVFRARESERLYLWAAAAFLVGFGSLLKIPMAGFGLLLVYAALAEEVFSFRKTFPRLAAILCGAALPVLACCFYFYSQGVLQDFLANQLVWAPQYAKKMREHFEFACLLKALARPVMGAPYGMGALGLASWILQRTRRERMPLPTRLLWVWLALGVLLVLLQSRFAPMHFLVVIPPLALLVAGAIDQVIFPASTKSALPRTVVWILLAFTLVVPVVKLAKHTQYAWNVYFREHQRDEILELGRHLRPHTSPDETVFVWGDVPGIYIYAERKSSSRFIAAYFVATHWEGLDFQRIFMKEFTSRPPRFFVLWKDDLNSECSSILINYRETLREFGALQKIVDAQYVVDQTTDHYVLYRQKVLAPPPAVQPR